jgi:hypothetical protein
LPFAVAEDLKFDMARIAEVFLHIDGVIAEGGLGLGPRLLKAFRARPRSLATFMPRPPPPAAALMITG